MTKKLFLAALASVALCASSQAAPLCKAASKQWLDFVEDDPPPVLELDNGDCSQQVAVTKRIISCADNYLDPKRPVYDQSVALDACASRQTGAHYYTGIPGRPYPAHTPADLTRRGGP